MTQFTRRIYIILILLLSTQYSSVIAANEYYIKYVNPQNGHLESGVIKLNSDNTPFLSSESYQDTPVEVTHHSGTGVLITILYLSLPAFHACVVKLVQPNGNEQSFPGDAYGAPENGVMLLNQTLPQGLQ